MYANLNVNIYFPIHSLILHDFLQHFVSRVKITNVILQPDILLNQAIQRLRQSVTKRNESVKILTIVVQINGLLP